MPVAPTYPGVYIEEIASGVRTITGVSTSVAAFVDFFARGPLNEAVQLFSYADFEREFGGLDARSEASYGIAQFFLNGGSQAWVVRVGNGTTTAPLAAAQVVLRDKPGAGAIDVVRVTAGQRVRGDSVPNPGAWGNALRVEVDYDTTKPDEFFNLAVSEVAVRGGRPVVLRTETFRNLTMREGVPNNALEVVNDGSSMVQLDRGGLTPSTIPTPFDVKFRPAGTGTLSNDLPAVASIPPQGTTLAVNPGSGNVNATLDYAGAAPPTDYPNFRRFLESAIRAADTQNQLLAGATVQLLGSGTTANPFRFRVQAGRAGADFTPEATLAFSGAAATTLRLNTLANVQQYSVGTGAAGAQGGAVAGADGALPNANALQGTRSAKSGLFALEDVDLFNILCMPAAAELAPTDFGVVVTQAEAYCEERRAFMIVDIPRTINTLAEMQTWMTQNDTLRHRNAAVYFPRPLIPDSLNENRLRSVGASGTLAGLYAQTDVARGVWKAPAGTDARLRNVQNLDYILTDPENGALNPLGINCLRRFPVFGHIAWGARTLDGSDQQASEWKYIPVRRFALFLEESLYRGSKWIVFEPNDEPLWAQIRLNIGAFMQTLFRQGAFQGKTPREAYFVKCDRETTTQTDINLGIVNIVVGFAPLKPAEFVIIKIQQMAGEIPT
ncbi:MAG TPA: phage tail sheath C-terminal domain-containing protein [Abditibacteriaceae bacterium]|jgi:hypothetical protein